MDFQNTTIFTLVEVLNFSLEANFLNLTNVSVEYNLNFYRVAFITLTSFLLGLIILATVVGNVFVIAAILLEKNLQTVANSLVLSLAVADLLVACLVMPLGAVYEVSQEWTLGSEVCEIWTSCDVLCCTASILHLLAIAADRYWAVTNIDYVRQRNNRHISVMISLVWIVSFVVSVCPVFGWKDPDFQRRITEEKRCMVSQDVAYQLFATCSSFYIPLILIIILYWRIYKVAKKRIRQKPGGKVVPRIQAPEVSTIGPSMVEMTLASNTSSSHPSSDATTTTTISTNGLLKPPSPHHHHHHKKTSSKESIKSKKERKAAKTLAIITGIFIVCWMPFFATALMVALCNTCELHDLVFSVFLWLGYANSMINPIIYTVFSPDFRSAFKRILFLRRSQRWLYSK